MKQRIVEATINVPVQLFLLYRTTPPGTTVAAELEQYFKRFCQVFKVELKGLVPTGEDIGVWQALSEKADIVIPLLDEGFINDDFLWKLSETLVTLHGLGKPIVIPLILEAVSIELTPFEKIVTFLPSNGSLSDFNGKRKQVYLQLKDLVADYATILRLWWRLDQSEKTRLAAEQKLLEAENEKTIAQRQINELKAKIASTGLTIVDDFNI